MNTNLTLNDTLKAAYHTAVTRIQATPKFIKMYEQFVCQLTANANAGNRIAFQMQVGYDMLYPMIDKLTADGLEVSHWDDTVEARIKLA